MFFRAAIFVFVGLFGVPLPAQTSLDNARQAQTLLGAGVWSQLIEVTNESRSSVYPKKVHALVFELAEILWFYTDTDGTQSFSLHRGMLAQEKADFAPLLRDIDPGFARWVVLAEAPPPRFENGDTPLKNGCFIESVVALRQRLMRGAKREDLRLLSYYISTKLGQEGHTVLICESEGRVEVFDPARPGVRLEFPQKAGRDPLALARLLDRRAIAKARYLPTPVGVEPAAVASSVSRARLNGATSGPSGS